MRTPNKVIPVSRPARLAGVYMGNFHPAYQDLATSQVRSCHFTSEISLTVLARLSM